jgi:hypothetical protein
MSVIARDNGMPTTIWLCPSHFPYAYVDHGGTCPEGGCTQRMVPYAQQAPGAVEALRSADRLADAITLHCDRDDVLDFAAKYEKARTPTRDQS